MKLILLMAGYGTRMRPHTWSKPKPLISLAGKPALDHILDMVKDLDIEEYIFVVGYLGRQIEDYMSANHPQLKARYVEQKELLGQAHALLLCRDYVDGPVAVLFSDTLMEADMQNLADTDADGVIFVKEVPDPRRFGVAVTGEQGDVARFIEKPSSLDNNNVVIGFYYLKNGPELMRRCQELVERDMKTKGEYYLADALTLMVESGSRLVTQEVEVWEDCGKPETTLHSNRWLLEARADNSAEATRPGVVIIPPVYVAPSATVIHSVIGPYASIGPGCRLERTVVRDSIIEAGATVEDIVLDQAFIGDNAEVYGQPQRLNVGDSSTLGVDYLQLLGEPADEGEEAA